MSINAVAPLAGAWIEMIEAIKDHGYDNVAPLAGAWIEIFFLLSLHKQFLVAPLAGAWIEMCWMGVLAKCQTRSLPSRERGLKYRISFFKRPHHTVAPLAGAWIEICV